MEKEFVTYELALKLKELGFDEPCWGYYHVNEGYSIGYAFCYSDRESQPYYGCSAPLFQQAFRWLYQKLNIDKGIMPLDVESQDLLLNELLDKLSSKHLLV